MKTRKIISMVSCLVLLLGLLVLQIAAPLSASAANEPTEKITLSTKYPSLSGKTNDTFTFNIDTMYVGGTAARTFNLAVSGPSKFFYSITSLGGSTDITAIKLDPVTSYPETIAIKALPNPLDIPNPGKYTVTFTVSAGDIKSSIDVTVEITARYAIQVMTPDGLLSTTVTADQSNPVKLELRNTGSSPLDKIVLSQYIKGAPSGWEIKFDPEKIDTLAPGNDKEVTMSVKPSSKTISGDYEIVVTGKTEANTASSDITLRVTVLTQQIWGWVGIGIIVLVVAGLIAMFILLGRR
jgi:uncharacterized membrane protein